MSHMFNTFEIVKTYRNKFKAIPHIMLLFILLIKTQSYSVYAVLNIVLMVSLNSVLSEHKLFRYLF